MIRTKYIVVFAMMSLLTACGGGGGGGDGTSSTAATVSGVASKGIIKKGTVNVFPVNGAGVKGSTPLAVGATDDNGAYSLNIGSYTGPVVVEVSGKYTDEATGNTLEVPASAPLHAALDNVTAGGSVNMPVTPLTELAFRQAGPALTGDKIKVANSMISSLMGIDIINTKPVAPNAAAFDSATQDQKNYALILAAVSQIMASKGTDLDSVLKDLNGGVNSTAATSAIYNALSTFASSSNNLTGDDGLHTMQTLNVVKQLRLTLTGSAVSSVRAIVSTLTLPDGLTLKTDNNGVPLPNVFQLIGSSANNQLNISYSHYLPASATGPATLTMTLLAPNGGLAAGDIFTIIFDVAAGSTVPPFTSDNLSGTRYWDMNGAELAASDRPVLSLY
jgi:hypothetical protein